MFLYIRRKKLPKFNVTLKTFRYHSAPRDFFGFLQYQAVLCFLMHEKRDLDTRNRVLATCDNAER